MTAPARRGPPPSRGLIDAPWFRALVGRLVALYIRLVRATNSIVRLPPDRAERLARFAQLRPAIIVSWHANVLAMPLFMERGMGEFVGIASPHPDGQLAAATMRALGFRTVFGTGVSDRQTEGTGGVAGMRALLRELEAGRSVYMTAEVPPTPGRRVSMGVIALARLSGRPIVAVAAASSRRTIVERLWDKMQINHPFGRVVLIADGPLMVDDTITNEEARDRLKALLDNAYAEAFRRVDAPAQGQ
ncbi:MAG TPA: DUF374 domain-containing protein [Alphaproteobacteria bacterium]|nr:DUF374 domain-containing protein [Alphaproteobacteria bacterium]